MCRGQLRFQQPGEKGTTSIGGPISCGQATALRFATPSACYVSRDRCGADGVVYSMLRGPYERRHRSLAERLLRVGLLGWLWFAACAIALAMAAVRFW